MMYTNGIEGLQFKDIHKYLVYNGWDCRMVEGKSLAYFSPPKNLGIPGVQIPIPVRRKTKGDEVSFAGAIETIAGALDLSADSLASEISHAETDLIQTTLQGQDSRFVPLMVAKSSVMSLVEFVRKGITTEHGVHTNAAASLFELCRFEHTIRGSFGFRIGVPVRAQALNRTTIERRVTLRIARGFLYTSKAVETGSIQPITENQHEAFDAQMCASLRDVLRSASGVVECSVRWASGTMPPSEFESGISVQLGLPAINYLGQAVRELEETTEPSDEVLVGNVIDLHSEDQPTLPTASRRITLMWHDPETNRDRPVRIELSAEDYERAGDAHFSFRRIQVTGLLEIVNRRLHLRDAHILQSPDANKG